MDKAQIYPDT